MVASAVVLDYATSAAKATAKLNDFYHEAWPAYAALVHGHLFEFLRLGPAYVGSLVLRAPFALIPSVWGEGSQAIYFASALPCLIAVVVFCTWLAAQPRRRGGIGWASRLMPIALCVINPIVMIGLFEGHPEDLLGAVLCVGAVMLAIDARVGWASLLLGLAVFNKPWALVAVPVVVVAVHGEHRRALLAATATAGAAMLAVTVVHGHGFSAGAAGAVTSTIFNPPQLLWWIGPHSWLVRDAHVVIVLAALPCAALWWLRRRGQEPTGGTLDPLLLLALVLLLRAALDPWNTLFYHVPFLFALLAYEIRSGRIPLMTIGYTVALLIVAPAYGIPHMSPDLRAALYAAIVIPTIGWLAARLYLPAGVYHPPVAAGLRRFPRRVRADSSAAV
jgi:hypothetical protein